MYYNFSAEWDKVESVLFDMLLPTQIVDYNKARALYFVRDKKWSNQETAEFIYNELFGVWNPEYDFITSNNGLLVAVKIK